MRTLAIALWALTAPACGSGKRGAPEPEASSDDDPGSVDVTFDPGAPAAPDDPVEGGDPVDPDDPAEPTAPTLQLRTSSYHLEPGEEIYRCSWVRLEGVPDATGARTLAPIGGDGVHHVALFATTGAPEEDRDCWSLDGDWMILAGAGVGTGATELPHGVAIPIHDGAVYVLQLHMLNATADALDVIGGYDLALTEPGEAWERAGLLNVTTTSIAIPPDTDGTEADATCAGRLDGVRLVSLFPHMHRLGVRFVAELVQPGGSSTLFDGAWQFQEQAVFPLDPAVPLAGSDALRIRCTWDNPTDEWIGFGENTDSEMCGAAFYYTPAETDEIRCVD